MTFDLPPDVSARQHAIRDRAQRTLALAAPVIDRTGVIPPDVRAELEALRVWDGSLLAAVVALEEVAAASAAAAAQLVLGHAADAGLAGLRGVAIVGEPAERQVLGMAAVGVGIGRAAVQAAVDTARARGDRPTGDPADPPHWVLADAATEVDAARLLVYGAAAGRRGVGGAAALVFAGSAAIRAVEAALRVVGPEAWQPGALLERCARDARAVLLVAGTEEAARRRAADGLLDQPGR